jgi:hypothetical protein
MPVREEGGGDDFALAGGQRLSVEGEVDGRPVLEGEDRVRPQPIVGSVAHGMAPP